MLGRHALAVAGLEGRAQRGLGDLEAALDRVVTVDQYFGLDDRDDVRFLAQGRIAGQCVGVGLDAGSGLESL